jgi:hypothetical protein
MSRGAIIACFVLFCCFARGAETTLQFDVFLGYDGVVPEASWFPVLCEIKNDGPTFNGTIEVECGSYNQGQTRKLAVELPTGTLKRVVIPVFSTTRGYSSWDVRLYDQRGKVRAEQLSLRARRQTQVDTPLIGAMPRSATGTPTTRPVLSQLSELQPASARFQTPIFPDNPLVLEGMSTLYLNSERAAEMRVPNQVDSLYAWVNGGGHLIVGIEQITDVNSVPWLHSLLPIELKDIQSLSRHTELQEWLKTGNWRGGHGSAVGLNPFQPGRQLRTTSRPGADESHPFPDLADDFTFEGAPLQVATGTLRDGKVVVAAGDTPLVVTANRGRGAVTVLLFSPEREPVKSWKNLPTFWSRMADIPGAWYVSSDVNRQGGWSTDGIFGGMIDSRQIHRLPVGWLLLLFLVYLLVIGPLDQYWLKRIGKPMLTWITFPCYVVFFSLLIYGIGYKLRAGESEWNELNLVDVVEQGDHAQMRGRTYASIYSPSNQRYLLKGQDRYSTLRAEFAGTWSGGQTADRGTVQQEGDNFSAEVLVPVWTSQLFVSDWWNAGALPVKFSIAAHADNWDVKVENLSDKKISSPRVVIGEYVLALGDVEPGAAKTFNISKDKAVGLRDFLNQHAQSFQSAVNNRRAAFGSGESGRISDLPEATLAVSFTSQIEARQQFMSYIQPPGLDLSPELSRGEAILFAWAPDVSPVKPMNQFSPRRVHRNTMWRVAAAVQ